MPGHWETELVTRLVLVTERTDGRNLKYDNSCLLSLPTPVPTSRNFSSELSPQLLVFTDPRLRVVVTIPKKPNPELWCGILLPTEPGTTTRPHSFPVVSGVLVGLVSPPHSPRHCWPRPGTRPRRLTVRPANWFPVSGVTGLGGWPTQRLVSASQAHHLGSDCDTTSHQSPVTSFFKTVSRRFRRSRRSRWSLCHYECLTQWQHGLVIHSD